MSFYLRLKDMGCVYHLLSDLALSASTFPSYTQTHIYALPILSFSVPSLTSSLSFPWKSGEKIVSS